MSWEIIGLIIILAITILAIIFRKTPIIKKYWSILLILIPVAFILILKIIQDSKNKKSDNSSTDNSTKNYIQEVKEQITEVQTIAKVEAAIAKTKNEETMNELKEVQAIQDDRERRRRLADMIG